jgi:hypothetical protein
MVRKGLGLGPVLSLGLAIGLRLGIDMPFHA